MNNSLISQSNWSVFNKKDNSFKTFDNFIDFVSQLDGDTSPDLWVKWKEYSNQVVIATSDNYFKLYQHDYVSGMFWAHIRDVLGDIYREKFNILWDVYTIQKENYIYTIEKRQKLTVCKPNCIDFDKLLLNWSDTLRELEKRLYLDVIVLQIRDKIPEINEIHLIRNCVNKYADYGLTESGDIVLLDDSDWFLAPIDKEGNWLNLKWDSYEVIIDDGTFIFAPEGFYNQSSLRHSDEYVNKWQLFKKNESEEKCELNFNNIRENMLKTNIKLISTQELPKEKILTYDNERDYANIDFEQILDHKSYKHLNQYKHNN